MREKSPRTIWSNARCKVSPHQLLLYCEPIFFAVVRLTVWALSGCLCMDLLVDTQPCMCLPLAQALIIGLSQFFVLAFSGAVGLGHRRRAQNCAAACAFTGWGQRGCCELRRRGRSLLSQCYCCWVELDLSFLDKGQFLRCHAIRERHMYVWIHNGFTIERFRRDYCRSLVNCNTQKDTHPIQTCSGGFIEIQLFAIWDLFAVVSLKVGGLIQFSLI